MEGGGTWGLLYRGLDVARKPRPGRGGRADSIHWTVRLGDKRKGMTPIGGSH